MPHYFQPAGGGPAPSSAPFDFSAAMRAQGLVSTLESDIRGALSAVEQLGDAMNGRGAGVGGYASSLQAIGANAGGAATGLSAMGRTIAALAGPLGQVTGLQLALGAALSASTREAVAYERQMERVRSVTGESRSEM